MDVEEVKGMAEGDCGGVLVLKGVEKVGSAGGHCGRSSVTVRWAVNESVFLQMLDGWMSEGARGSRLIQTVLWPCGPTECLVFGIGLSKRQFISQMSSWKNSYKFSFWDWAYFQVFPG